VPDLDLVTLPPANDPERFFSAADPGADQEWDAWSAMVNAPTRNPAWQAQDQAYQNWGPLFSGYNAAAVGALTLMPPGVGFLVSLCSGAVAQQFVVYALGQAQRGDGAWLMAYTIDMPSLTQALEAAAARQVHCSIYADHHETLEGQTREQLPTLRRLRANGVNVCLASGLPLVHEYANVGRTLPPARQHAVGRLHAKTFLVWTRHAGAFAVIGSANWTTSTRCNLECCAVLKLTAAGLASLQEFKARLVAQAVPLATAQEQAERSRRRVRPRSIEPPRSPAATVGATQRRYRDARTRNRSVDSPPQGAYGDI